MRRNPDDTLDGAAALDSLFALYDAIGGYRGELIALRCKVRASQGMTVPAWCPRAPTER